MADQKAAAIPLPAYEDMLGKYGKAKGRIMDLGLEIFELHEGLGHALN